VIWVRDDFCVAPNGRDDEVLGGVIWAGEDFGVAPNGRTDIGVLGDVIWAGEDFGVAPNGRDDDDGAPGDSNLDAIWDNVPEGFFAAVEEAGGGGLSNFKGWLAIRVGFGAVGSNGECGGSWGAGLGVIEPGGGGFCAAEGFVSGATGLGGTEPGGNGFCVAKGEGFVSVVVSPGLDAGDSDWADGSLEAAGAGSFFLGEKGTCLNLGSVILVGSERGWVFCKAGVKVGFGEIGGGDVGLDLIDDPGVARSGRLDTAPFRVPVRLGLGGMVGEVRLGLGDGTGASGWGFGGVAGAPGLGFGGVAGETGLGFRGVVGATVLGFGAVAGAMGLILDKSARLGFGAGTGAGFEVDGEGRVLLLGMGGCCTDNAGERTELGEVFAVSAVEAVVTASDAGGVTASAAGVTASDAGGVTASATGETASAAGVKASAAGVTASAAGVAASAV
jgi:hypothetical protein